MIGTQLGKNYQVVDKIGDGGMGVVYLVEHVTLHKQFAAKVLSAELATNEEAKARFEVEAHAASKLEHENVVSVTDYGVADDGRPYLVMELLRGKTLYERISEGPVSIEETVAIVVPVCRGLAAAHDEGFVHRDVKPENIMLVQRGGRFTVKVLDFGITKLRAETSRLTKMGQALGSPMYMAPETCKGDEIDPRADIYAVGVLLYQLVCGKLPFYDDNMLKIVQMQVSQPLTPPRQVRPDISEPLEAVICKALEKDPDRRYQTIEELEDELLAAIPPGADVLLHGRRSTPLPMSVATGPSGSVATVRAASGANVVITSAPARRSNKGLIFVLVAAILAVGGGIVLFLKLGTKPVARDMQATKPEGPAVAADAAQAVATPSGAGSETPTGSATTTAAAPVAAPVIPAGIKLTVTSRPSGADVTLDGKALGKTPLDTTVPSRAERGVLTISAKGHKTAERDVAGDRDAELSVDLVEVERPAQTTVVKKPPIKTQLAPDKKTTDSQTTKNNNDGDIRGAR